MLRNNPLLRLLAAVLLLVAAHASAAPAADIYAKAVAHPGRSADDLKRDATDHPAAVLRAAGIKPGMQVADFLAADGYYSELLSYVVGDSGHVLLLNNPAYDKFANNAWQQRIDRQHLDNVEHRTIDPAAMGLAPGSLDAIVMVKVYHDLYWVAPQDGWPRIDVPAVLDQLVAALKPGGLILVVDHSAKPGSGSSVAGSLHRIGETFMRADFQAHGLKFVRKSDVLRNHEDRFDKISYKPPMLGKTDRFVYVFRKPRPR